MYYIDTPIPFLMYSLCFEASYLYTSMKKIALIKKFQVNVKN